MSAQTPPRRVVVVGAGPAAHRFAESIMAGAADRAADEHPIELTIVGEEPHLPYDRVALSRRLLDADDLTLGDGSLWASSGVPLRRGVGATSIDPVDRTVTLADGDLLDYDELVLATGSSATVPPIPGAQHGRV